MGISLRAKKTVKGFSLDLSLEIGNECAVLFGYSGAGKSMTLQIISGLMEPDEGLITSGKRVLYDRRAGINIPPQQRNFGYVQQDPALFPHMTVAGNILYSIRNSDKAFRSRQLEEVISVFHLEGLGRKYPGEISGGQKQRVALARALVRRPDVLLLDEPFSALDAPIRIEMRKLLRNIRKDFHIPLILITHDISEACEIGDKMFVYSCGRVQQSGPPGEVIAEPVNTEVSKLVRNPFDLLTAKAAPFRVVLSPLT